MVSLYSKHALYIFDITCLYRITACSICSTMSREPEWAGN